MFRWVYEVCYRYKSIVAVWRYTVGYIVLAAGCQTLPDTGDHTDNRPANANAVSVNPRYLGTSSIPAILTSNESLSNKTHPLQTAEAFQYGLPTVSIAQNADAADAVRPAGGRVAESIGSSLPVGVPNTLDLGVALRLAGVNNPTINLAQERIREALGLQLNARVLLLPNLNIGGNYHYNNGPIQSSTGQILPVANQVLYLGAGAGAIGSGTVAIPGIWLFANLGDAVYEPLAARQTVVARRSDSAATQNAVMGDVVTAYLRLVGSEARLDVLRRADVEGSEVVRLTSEYAKAGQGRLGDANRSKALINLVERERRAAEEEVEVAAAQLCRLVNIDPSYHFRTPDLSLETFHLINEDADAEALVVQAIQARPELATCSATIQEAQIRVRQQKIRPFLPTLSVGVSTGAFGGGSDLVTPGFSQLAGRTDIDVMAVWNIQNLGFGNRARVREASAVVGQAVAEYELTKNRIRREVLDAVANARAANRQLELAQSAVLNSMEGFQLDLQRIKGGAGVGANDPSPIELLDSFQEVLNSRQSLVAAVTAFDIAQFRLFVALGSNPLNGPDVSRKVPTAIPNIPIGNGSASQEPVPTVPPKNDRQMNASR
jgi:outer membrane protein TolC